MYQPDLWGAGLKTLAMLCIVIGVLILVLFLMRRFLYLREGPWQGQLIRMLSSYHVTPKERIALIDVAGEKIVIGITPENITSLAKIDNPEALEQIERVKPHGRRTDGFRKVLDIVSRRPGRFEQEIE